MDKGNGKLRVIVERITPEIDAGRYAIKRVVGESVQVEADVFTDGHDDVYAQLLYRFAGDASWQAVRMHALGNDRWRATFPVTQQGTYEYTVAGWVDRFGSWRHALLKKQKAGQVQPVDWQTGVGVIKEAASRASGESRQRLQQLASDLESQPDDDKLRLAHDDDVAHLAAVYPDPELVTRYERTLGVVVDRERAGFSAWYEFFPRSCAAQPGKHGTFRDCEARLAYAAELGFDVVYLPPIHPIGVSYRKGKNNAPTAGPGDAGSPWGIGGKEGGHDAIHPELGTLDDFRRLVRKAREYGMELALDIAFQCTPDHPYVREHPDWFRKRPDGTIQYAENPPKKYQDIYPIDFECESWRELWDELKRVVLFWVKQDVRIFRVDNPHTKPFRFWEWLITEVKKEHPDVLFLSEAFTRPKVRYCLAKLGFTQSYTYFAWRNTKRELTQYLTELTKSEVRDYFRPNFWPNTPDILTEFLQYGGRPAFMIRLLLAGTLTANYGIYGPAFELLEHQAREPGSEEYLNSEKYEVRHWNLDDPKSLKGLITRLNQIRRENRALHSDRNLQFHPVDNEELLCYSKRSDDGQNVILVVINLDPRATHAGWVDLPLESLGMDTAKPTQVHDLLTDARYLWHGNRHYVELNPQVMPAHVFRLLRRVRSERDFEYYL